MMNLQYKNLLPSLFSPESRVWIYQSSRLFTVSEAFFIEDKLNEFAAQWTSHGDPVKGSGHLFFGRFIILLADESATGVSGCSTDGSVRLIKSLESELHAPFFDRQLLALIVKDKIELMPLVQLRYAAEHRFIGPDTLYFNNAVQTKKELEENWIIPLRQSWLAKKIQFGDLPISRN
jgi:hypothetical protein